MKKTTSKLTRKLQLQRDIIRQLTDRDLRQAQGGDRDLDDDEGCGGGRCTNPVYSALETK